MSDSQRWIPVIAVILLGWVLYKLAPVLTPFMIAALLSYLGDPLADRLEARGLSRTFSVVIVFVVMVVLGLTFLLILIPVLQRQVAILIEKVPQAVQWLQESAVPYLAKLPGVDPSVLNVAALKHAVGAHWQQVGGALTQVIAKVTASGQAVLSWVAYLMLIPVVTFYLLRDWDVLVSRVRALLPRNVEPTVVLLVNECDQVLAQFLRGQLLVMLSLAVIYSFGLWLAGIDLAFLVGMLAGLVSFVPYLGFIVGILLASFAAVMQFGDATHLIYVVIVFGIGQAMEGMVLSPLLVGERIGLHPVAVIFAVMAGGQLFGFFGVLLALPVAAVVVVLLRHSHDRYIQSRFYTP
jgi:predicted PurR-regulated permease PerM